MNPTTPPSRRSLSARRVALLATTIAGFGAAAFLAPYAAPRADFFSAPAHAQNLTQQAQQLAQKPVGFADIVEKVKPAVISVRVKMERPAEVGPSSDEMPFPPGSPFERFFRRFGMPNTPHRNSARLGGSTRHIRLQNRFFRLAAKTAPKDSRFGPAASQT